MTLWFATKKTKKVGLQIWASRDVVLINFHILLFLVAKTKSHVSWADDVRDFNCCDTALMEQRKHSAMFVYEIEV